MAFRRLRALTRTGVDALPLRMPRVTVATMCILSSRDKEIDVSRTRLFARRVRGRQLLVYAMRLQAEDRSAMLLPIPIVPGVGEDAVVFRDLSGVPDLFDVLECGFPSHGERERVARDAVLLLSEPHLEVL